MAQVITGLDNIPISAASAAYAPTNTADVTAMIDSAVSGKLDASASSSFQPVGNYVSSSDLSGYLPTSSIGVDSASAVTSIAGSSIASGEQVVTSITTGGYGVSAINGTVINASHMKLGAEAADNSINVVKLGYANYGAGVFLTGNFGTAYYKVNELQLNRNGTGFIGFNIGGAGSQITATSNAGGKFSAGGTGGNRSYFTAFNASASASIEVTANSAKINLADSGYTSTIYPSSIPYWNSKLDASSIETSVDGITGIGGTAIAGGGGTTYSAGQYIQISGDEISVTGLQPSGDYVSSSDMSAYQPTSSMSAYATTDDLSAKLDASASSSFITSTAGLATTGDLTAKLDVSASSSFITSTADCMPLSSSSEYYSTSNPAGYITGVDLTPYQTTAGMSAYLPTSAIHSDSAGITSIGGTAVGGKDYTAGTGIDITNNVVSVDTSVVATQTDLASKQDTLTAGTNVSITNNVISATDTTYSAGTGIDITDDVISVETPVDIVAGPGIVIDNPDGNTVRISYSGYNEVELYSHTSVANNAANTVLNMNEPVTNFERIRVECWNREFNVMRRDFEFTLTDSTTSTRFIADMDASQSVGDQQRVNIGIGYNSDGNLVDLFHGLFFGNGSNYTKGNDRGLGIHRVVGIHRIANN